MTISVQWKGQEIMNPAARFVVAGVAVVLAPIAIALGIVALVASLIIAVPLHPIFVLFGRRGFFTYRGHEFTFQVGADAFKPRAAMTSGDQR